MTESLTLDPLSFSCFALVFVIKQSDAALSLITFSFSSFGLTLCTCNRQESIFVL